MADDQKEKLEEFWKVNSYVAGSYDDPSGYQALDAHIRCTETNCKEMTGKADRIFYLALPPSVFIPVTQKIHDHCESKS